MSSQTKIVLKPGREKSVLRRHPWIFSGAIERVEGAPDRGESAAVFDSAGQPLGTAAYSPDSQIVGRIWSFNPEEPIDAAFIEKRVNAAMSLRKSFAKSPAPCGYRLINAESDGLPGAIVDVYGNVAVCQFGSAGADKWKAEIAKAVASAAGCSSVYERADIDARLKEGLPQNSGTLFGDEAPEKVAIVENGIHFSIDIRKGHKTGFYLDQRDSRKAVMEQAASAEDVLNCFSYTGGFGLAALKGGAKHAVNVDLSADALALARENAEANGFSEEQFDTMEADVFTQLRKFRDARRSFDFIVLDPPKFADAKGHVDKAARGYKDINLLGIKLLRPGGTLFTFSCSAAIDCELFQKIVASAALDAKRELKIAGWLSQSADHHIDSAFPEGRYLKGLACKIL